MTLGNKKCFKSITPKTIVPKANIRRRNKFSHFSVSNPINEKLATIETSINIDCRPIAFLHLAHFPS